MIPTVSDWIRVEDRTGRAYSGRTFEVLEMVRPHVVTDPDDPDQTDRLIASAFQARLDIYRAFSRFLPPEEPVHEAKSTEPAPKGSKTPETPATLRDTLLSLIAQGRLSLTEYTALLDQQIDVCIALMAGLAYRHDTQYRLAGDVISTMYNILIPNRGHHKPLTAADVYPHLGGGRKQTAESAPAGETKEEAVKRLKSRMSADLEIFKRAHRGSYAGK